ncbi:MAG TPA: copper resistance protein CopC [Ktedonobacteraceae bacterium]|nr:copper resistance protein CopC [Ktedonobacteraceae bacterium]
MRHSLSLRGIKLCANLCTGVLLALLYSSSAFAHAQYDHSNPPANAHMPSGHPPAHVEVWFTEHIEPAFSWLEIYDAHRQRVDRDDCHPLPNDSYGLTISLHPHLPDGAYTVVFHTVSADDGHVVTGSFSFAVGSGPLPTSNDALLSQLQTTDTNVNVWSIVLRWFDYLAMAILVGSLVFFLLVWSPAASLVAEQVGSELLLAQKRVGSRVHTLLLTSLVALLAVQIALLFYQTALTSAGTLWQTFSNGATLQTMLLSSRFGHLWLIRLALLLIAFALWFCCSHGKTIAPGLSGSTIRFWLLVLTGIGIMLTISLDAHAAATTSAWLLVPADVIHLISTACWLGGLFTLVLTLPPTLRVFTPGTGDRTRLLAALLPRFTAIALMSVALLLLTGTLQAAMLLHLPSATINDAVNALTATAYGRTLLVKLLLFAVLLGFGAFNMLVVSKRLHTFALRNDKESGASSFAAGRMQRTFHKTISGEALVAVGLLLVVGVLTSLSPPPAHQPDATQGPAVFRGTLADMTYTLIITPGKVGPNAFETALTDQHGQPVQKTDAVLLRFVMLDMDMGEQELRLDPVKNSPGHYHTTDDTLSMAGHWQLFLLVRRPGFEDARVSLSYTLAP